jgi:large subunit ribosomal protein L25
MAVLTLHAHKRTNTGKGAARKARAAGRIPGIFYGPGEEAVPLDVVAADFMRIYHGGHGENVLVDLEFGEGQPSKVLFREVQRDPVTETVMHIDFYHVSLTKAIRVHVPVHLEGVPDGVKNAGGVLQHVMREVEVECLPTDIPERITVDVSGLGIHDAVHIRDLPAVKWVFTEDPGQTVASVIPPVVVKEPVPGEAEVAEGEEAKEPERIGGKEEKEEPAEAKAGKEGKPGKEAKEGKESKK